MGKGLIVGNLLFIINSIGYGGFRDFYFFKRAVWKLFIGGLVFRFCRVIRRRNGFLERKVFFREIVFVLLRENVRRR